MREYIQTRKIKIFYGRPIDGIFMACHQVVKVLGDAYEAALHST
jgi:hypothetical protein